jgi:hypothetical protein
VSWANRRKVTPDVSSPEDPPSPSTSGNNTRRGRFSLTLVSNGLLSGLRRLTPSGSVASSMETT